jgi:hypothetical protein
VQLEASLREQGTKDSGYEEKGPYYCGACIHKVHPNVPICVHPEVVHDPALREKQCWVDDPMSRNRGMFIDLEKGCCKYVSIQPQE